MSTAITAQSSPQQFENAPIYRASEKLLINANVIWARMTKAHKFCTGTKLGEAALNISKYIALAYIEAEADKKLYYLKKVEECCVECMILHRLAYNINILSTEGNVIARKLYAEQTGLITSVLKQCKGWIKSVQDSLSK